MEGLKVLQKPGLPTIDQAGEAVEPEPPRSGVAELPGPLDASGPVLGPHHLEAGVGHPPAIVAKAAERRAEKGVARS